MSVVQLQCDTVRLLSCSQVVTSIHAVVKELVENSLDAKATTITIRLENYGLDVIEVKDNGSGVKGTDAHSMALPHSTSKIATFSDLCTLETYGFRGEALHSIAAMASLSVTTRTEDETIAHTYQFGRAGEVVSSKPVAFARGTMVLATNLFKLYPVRRQYYNNPKRCKEELRKIENNLFAFGIGHPKVYFQLRHNKHTLWQKPVAAKFETNLQNILGPSAFEQMIPVSYHCFNPMVKIQAYVPKGQGIGSGWGRSASERVFLLVNKRPVVIKSLLQLVKQAFLEAFPAHSSCPVAVLSITVMPQAMDVNLEPNKTSVLLHDLDFITTTLQSLLEQVYSPFRLCAAQDKSSLAKLVASANNSFTEGTNEEEGVEECTEGVGEVEGTDAKGMKGMNEGTEDGTEGEVEDADVMGEPQGLAKVTVEGQSRWEREGTEDNTGEKSEDDEVMEGQSCAIMEKQEVKNDLSDSYPADSWLHNSDSPPVDCEELDLSDVTPDMIQDFMSESDEDVKRRSSPPSTATCSSPPTRPSLATPPSPPTRPSLAKPPSPVATSAGLTPPLQTTLSQWSRGRSIDEHSKQMEPVRVYIPKASPAPPTRPLSRAKSKSKLFPGSSPIFDMINSQPVKRKSPTMTAPTHSKRQKLLSSSGEGTSTSKESMTASSKWCTGDGQVQFDMAGVSRRCASQDSSQSGDTSWSEQCRDKVIGWCPQQEQPGEGVWLVVNNDAIACFNVCRAKESFATSNDSSLDKTADSTEGTRLSVTEVESLLNKTITGTNRCQFLHTVHKL